VEKMPAKLSALSDGNRGRRPYHVLVDEDLSFTQWLRRRIDRYLSEKEWSEPRPVDN
jgi:hypothetical protein